MSKYYIEKMAVTEKQKWWVIAEATRTGATQAEVVRRLIQAQIDKNNVVWHNIMKEQSK